ncbi:MAG TPA: DNA-3-methyladenine glycosylase [Bacteroidales bacterium]|nr:DNA-3-methyladenine glycosylase [Bacteroidales bacterium]HPS72723.1 DNA-3-methyladenine glycosylase [Bacteroidales bacterium]
MVLPHSFYNRPDVVGIARELLGKYLCTRFDGVVTAGMITETEAYAGVIDKASHAWNGRRTARTEIMYRRAGTAYVYLCYGIHSLFNVVTNREGIPHAILIRAIISSEGRATMMQRMGKTKPGDGLISGPGKVTRALGIHYAMTGADLTREPSGRKEDGIWIEDRKTDLSEYTIEATPRIGVDYAGEDATLPYRFLLSKK